MADYGEEFGDAEPMIPDEVLGAQGQQSEAAIRAHLTKSMVDKDERDFFAKVGAVLHQPAITSASK